MSKWNIPNELDTTVFTLALESMRTMVAFRPTFVDVSTRPSTEANGGIPDVFVSEKFTAVSPVAVAVTVYGPPIVPFAVNGADATPDTSVATTILLILLANNPDAPDPGAVNVTFTPETGLFPASRTVTAGVLVKAVLITALCGVVPTLALILEGSPEIFVNEKLTEGSPFALAVTV